MNLDQLARLCENVAANLEKPIKEARDEVVVNTFRRVVERSPVRTGAYRSRHQVAAGKGRGSIVFQHPEIAPKGGLPVNRASNPVVRPSLGEVRASIRGIRAFTPIRVFNNIDYAGLVEFGDGKRRPYLVYEGSVNRGEAEKILEDKLKRFFRRLA